MLTLTLVQHYEDALALKYASKVLFIILHYLFIEGLIIAPPTTQGHRRAFHKFKSHTSCIKKH